MSKLFIGFRAEVSSKLFNVRDLAKKYNPKNKTQIFGVHREGRIVIEKNNGMQIAGGTSSKQPTGLVNFSVMIEMSTVKDVDRLVQIMNVLGNDRLIREKISTFVNEKSILNSIPELAELKTAFVALDLLIPGFIRSGWYYAPDAILK